MKIIDKKEFAMATLDPEEKILVVHIVSIIKLFYFNWKVLIAGLEIEKIIVLTKYLNFANIFFFNFVAKLPKYFGINNHFI